MPASGQVKRGKIMALRSGRIICRMLPLAVIFLIGGCTSVNGIYNVRSYGATGDGKTLDTDAVNNAITAANSAGGGTVQFPAGTYRCYSIHLKSNVTLYLGQGATILAAPPRAEKSTEPGYDVPEKNPWDSYEDFGHSHWHNSLIWGEGLENIAILGPGRIDGSIGLSRGGLKIGEGIGIEPPKPVTQPASAPTTATTAPSTQPAPEPTYPNPKDTLRAGIANKAIALKLCRNVVLRDFSIFGGGHFAILATGVDNFTLDNLKLDTNRDGMDIDCCKNVRVSNCYVNSPWDDGICLKSCFALGFFKATENVTITNCQVSGYIVGTLLDGTFNPVKMSKEHPQGPTGRIKLGTESSGGFKNITVTNCIFDNCRGLALETVDGGPLEDIAVSNITMRHINNSPIFIRLGSRLRSPEGTDVATCQRINISNIVVYDADPRYASIISGIPDYDIADVMLSHIQVFCQGGGTKVWAATQSAERENAYPEPRMFGETAAYGFFIRHVSSVELNDVKTTYEDDEARAPFVLDQVQDATFTNINAAHAPDVPVFVLKDVQDFSAHQVRGVADQDLPWTQAGQLPQGSAPTTQP
jgi:polygalacturonase